MHFVHIFKIIFLSKSLNSFFTIEGEKDTLICGSDKIRCYNEAVEKMFDQSYMKFCHCLPSCTSLTYDAEILQAKFDKADSFIEQKYEGILDELIGYVHRKYLINMFNFNSIKLIFFCI